MKHAKGFTLVELMITLVILAIIAAVAFPAYSSYVTRGKIAEATSNLASLRVTMEQFYQDNRTYLNGANCGATMPGSPAVKYFAFTCAGTQNTYTITATGQNTMTGFAYTVDNLNAKTSNITAAGWSNPSPNNCWVTNKGGLC